MQLIIGCKILDQGIKKKTEETEMEILRAVLNQHQTDDLRTWKIQLGRSKMETTANVTKIVAILKFLNCVVPSNQTCNTPTNLLTFTILLFVSTSGRLWQGIYYIMFHSYLQICIGQVAKM